MERLRFYLRELGVSIDTLTEPHGGNWPGHHARYVLRSNVSREAMHMEGGDA